MSTDASVIRKIEILKAASDPNITYREIAAQLDVSKGTISYTINEFCNLYQLTELEKDSPRKLVKFYNYKLPDGVTQLNDDDVRMLRRHVERVKRKEDLTDMADEMESLPSDDNAYQRHAQTISSSKMASNPTWQDGKNFDTTTEEGLWRNILYKGKMANPQAIERFIGLYNLGKKQYEADPNSLLDLMKHQFGQGFGTDAFNLFMRNRGFYLGDLSGANTNFTPGGGMNQMLMMLMMQAMNNGGDMSQVMPLLMQGGANGGSMGGNGGGGMDQMFLAMMMQDMARKREKEEKQAQFDQMLNLMMMRMIGGTMDGRNPMDTSSGQFMVQEILDKDGRSVKERHNIPIAAMMMNPSLAGNMFKGGADETTQLVLKNALDEKARAWEIMAQSQAPMNQILMTLIGNFQSKNDPVSQFAQLMDIREKYLPAGGAPPDPNIERMKIDLQLALNQQNMQLEQMKHQWDLEKTEKEQSTENVRNWMNMISDVGGKLAGPISQVAMGALGGGGLLGKGQAGGMRPDGPPPGSLPPMGSGPQPTGNVPPPPGAMQQPPRPGSGEDHLGPVIGTPDPDHGGELPPQVMMKLMEAENAKKANVAMAQEIQRLRGLVIANNAEHVRQQQTPREIEIDKEQLVKMKDEQIKELIDQLKATDQNTEHAIHQLENELADREWLTAPTPELAEHDTQEANRIARRNDREETTEDGVPLMESLEEEHVDDIEEAPISEMEVEENLSDED